MATVTEVRLNVPFFRPTITEAEIAEVNDCLRSGWLTTGPRVKQFETEFAECLGAKYAIALTSATAALHLAVESMGLKPGQAVLVPTMTFAATAEVVRYQGAIPILVDCDPMTLNMDLEDAGRKLDELRNGRSMLDATLDVVGIIPVHVGGLMMDVTAIHAFAAQHGLWVVEDAAHAFPAAFRSGPNHTWRWCGENTAKVTCFSFYANKTITTGEGGMAVTDDPELAGRIRRMSLHGLCHDAWARRDGTNGHNWDYRIVAAGYKYNLTDIAAAIGIQQLRRSESMRQQRQVLSGNYRRALSNLDQLELPPAPENRIHAWHLFPVRLRLEKLRIDRTKFLDSLRQRGVACSVHWRPLHLHPYYEETFGWKPHHLPVATSVWKQLISLPLFPSMRADEQEYVVQTVREICHRYAIDKSRNGNGRPKPR